LFARPLEAVLLGRVAQSQKASPPHGCGAVFNGRGNIVAKRLIGCTALMLINVSNHFDIAVQNYS
jgi:hypothetical protein